jgi:hypothetical protein
VLFVANFVANFSPRSQPMPHPQRRVRIPAQVRERVHRAVHGAAASVADMMIAAAERALNEEMDTAIRQETMRRMAEANGNDRAVAFRPAVPERAER